MCENETALQNSLLLIFKEEHKVSSFQECIFKIYLLQLYRKNCTYKLSLQCIIIK